MARTHDRSPTPDNILSTSFSKRLKTAHMLLVDGECPPGENPTRNNKSSFGKSIPPADQFETNLFNESHVTRLGSSYISNQPFKYAVVQRLFQDELLRKVKDECVSELNFTEKETDIYKVNQTGDLASLNFLDASQISLLPNLLILRDALYSAKFRSFLQSVTGCGPLSGKKQDMSVNSYTKGCHLLNHDDVIGTRRVSYVLYMPLPHYQMWQKEWGGALELYPVNEGKDGHLEPESFPSKSIPPSWNQFIFFEVQPGRSFHSVEEVIVGGGEDARKRLSISGWFHAAQEGEEGYAEEMPATKAKSSREQLASTSTLFKMYGEEIDPLLQILSEEHLSFLSEFLNPVYLLPRTMQALSTRFLAESSLELHQFLSSAHADALEIRLRDLDNRDGLGTKRSTLIPPHTAGTNGAWTVQGPPHKWRYCSLKPQDGGGQVESIIPRSAHASSDQIMRSLQDELFSSIAFRAWMVIVTRLLPLKYTSEARRFRPGLDYTLATSEETESRLDAVLGLTPTAVDQSIRNGGQFSRTETEAQGWHTAEWGGWECYMAPHNEEDDPAVYRSSSRKKRFEVEDDKEADAEADDDDDDDDDDTTLLTVQPGFNRLLLVLRDERVMRFVKYISAAAEGSRWDVCAEYEVGIIQEDVEGQ